MGIPSYYKKLIDTIPGLVRKGYPEESIAWLFMDFNCLIYHCLHRADTPIYPGDSEKDSWEAQFLECIQTYCLKVIKEVKPSKGVFIAIDGVVPMAKMRQQRLRRFKSVWLTDQEEKNDAVDGSKQVWDRNSITPGTAFMTKLRLALQHMISKHGKKTWKLSSSDEPGEGEHKIIQEWRKGTYKGNFAVYGLDADLIVLSILGRETTSLSNHVWLFREEIQGGAIAYDSMGEEKFEWFSIHALRDWLCADYAPDAQRTFLLNYCFAMSVLGNDFLPTSLGLKIREDGHSELLDIVKQLTSNQLFLVHPDNLSISFDGLLSLFHTLSASEEHRVTRYLSKKRSMSYHLANSVDHVPPKVGHHDWPLVHVEEDVLMESPKKLASDWKTTYMTHFFAGFHDRPDDRHKLCQEYLYGIQWIWAYYTGKLDDVCFNWYYPFSLPPLWSWIHAYLTQENVLPIFPKNVLVRAQDIRPVEQLALVLPLASWSLLPPGPEKKLPYLAPYLFPESFGFDTVGKRFFWECESIIPLPSIHTLKEIIRSHA